jgi:hypothetical protein
MGAMMLFASIMLAGTIAAGEAPKVIATSPASGDVAVDPALEELRVEFDVDMSPDSWSWVGGGPGFPETSGSARWATARECRLPVTLEPGHPYMVGINGGRFDGFRSLAGVPAPPRAIVFATAPEISGPPQWERHHAAVVRLRTLIEERYSHRDRLGLDWDALFEQRTEALADSRTAAAFAVGTWHLLEPTLDPHVSIEVEGVRLGIPVPAATANINGRTLNRFVPDLARRSPAVAVGRTSDGIGYINIMTWDRASAGPLEAAHTALDELAGAKALVIDVRLNGGGDEILAQRFAGRFVTEPVEYAKHRFVDPAAPDGFGPVVSRVLAPAEGDHFAGRVCVLMGPANMSSCEAFLLMMRAAPRCTLVGGRSLGSSGNPRAHDLGNGVTVVLPSWRAMDAGGTPFEGVGLEPDVAVKTTPADFADDDPVLRAALKLLRDDPPSAPPE